ncbi:hypothetical protein VTL71DRAFT_10021 [Oculimacula yallundae]|uniref:Uncharacterized protein n=1 Tax=Oculimacula yallundae TaxID=86028 RepID=A0ABR4BRX6_9HELO
MFPIVSQQFQILINRLLFGSSKHEQTYPMQRTRTLLTMTPGEETLLLCTYLTHFLLPPSSPCQSFFRPSLLYLFP